MMTTVTLLTAVTLMFSASTLLVSCSGGGDTPEKVSPTPTPTTPTNPTPDNPTQPDQPTNPDQPTQPDQPTVPTLPENVEIVLNATSSAINKGSTRATTIDTDVQLRGNDLKIDAYFHDTDTKYLTSVLSYQSSAWKFWESSSQQHYYWPIEGSVYQGATPITVSSLDFVGYCPYSNSNPHWPGYITADPTYNYSTGISFSANMSSYMTNDAQTGITEYMCAILPGQTVATQTAAGGALPLQLRHPFSRIKLLLAASHANVTIKSITFKTLKTGGSCVVNKSNETSWSSLTPAEGGTDLVTSFDGTGHVYDDNPPTPTQIGGDLIVIPQDWAGQIVVDAWCLFWGEKKHYENMTITIPTTWQAGYSYTYTFNISPDDLKVNVNKYTEQW